jgi:hypothetical protein
MPSVEEIVRYNRDCRQERPYDGPDVTPTVDECRNPPPEPLSTGDKIILTIFFVAGAALAIGVTIAASEVVIPAAIAALTTAEGAALSGWAFYAANAIVINDVGLFTAGLLLACEGDVAGLLRAMATDPAQAAQILAEVYVLHVNIKMATDPVRPATVPVKLLPADEQTDPSHILVKTVGQPTPVESTEEGTPPGGGVPGPSQGAPPRKQQSGESEQPEPEAPGPNAPGQAPGGRFFNLSRGPMTDAEKSKLVAARQHFNLPTAPTSGDTAIVGVLLTETGTEIPLRSGWAGVPQGPVPSGPGSGATRYNITHVESNAAGEMKARGITQAILLIEKEPCAACAGYSKVHPETDVQVPNLTQLLPKGAQLMIVDPDGTSYFRSTR